MLDLSVKFGGRFAAIAVMLLSPFTASAGTITIFNTLDVHIEANGDLSVPGSLTLTHTGTIFNSFGGSMNVQYKARTTAAGGGNITLKVVTDFQTAGPSVARGDLSYTCGAAGLGTSCSSSTVASTSSATNVVTLPPSGCTGGGGPCSASSPNAVGLTFTLKDDPSDKTGSYTAIVQFTISAT